jgi:hypothetical protein
MSLTNYEVINEIAHVIEKIPNAFTEDTPLQRGRGAKKSRLI